MKQLPSDKYTIAWFKLAEFVSRGEKEKALGIYKLLALSLNDPAFINKLEGDILYSFNDKSAEDKYYKAAILYQKDDRHIESAAIFENLLSLNESYDYFNKLLAIYKKLNLIPKIIATLRKMVIYCIKKKEFEKAIESLDNLEQLSLNKNSDLFEQISFELIIQDFDNKIILKHINKAIESYFFENKKNDLQQFISKLETINKYYYNEALKQLKE